MKKNILAVSLVVASIISSSAFAADAVATPKKDVKASASTVKEAKVVHKHKHHKKHEVAKKAEQVKVKA